MSNSTLYFLNNKYKLFLYKIFFLQKWACRAFKEINPDWLPVA